ncbi:acyltransferase [Massilimicrobiota sp. An80]|uniref:acyltransferase n=1 Tax=Massilimicrobiota sp. An80 TaxID=1965658 RepID=UPI000B44EC1F|nr:acyltransferase [Massilimicrobiota sp. An80]OUN37271.1 hypothetical protein B5G32_04695 [Massilimicrobiota sp. An80]
MNKYVRAAVVVPFGTIKICWTKIFHMSGFQGAPICMISPFTEISMDIGSHLKIGKMFKMRDGAKIRVRKGAECIIGNNTSVNSNNMIVCHEKIVIGDNVQFSPNVQVFDHDHDFRHPDGLKANHYKTAPIEIGNNVWIGANSIILKGTIIGDNAVIAAGSVIKGNIPDGTVVVQKRITEMIL